MNDRSAPYAVRVQAATEILNRGLGTLVEPQSVGFYTLAREAAGGTKVSVARWWQAPYPRGIFG